MTDAQSATFTRIRGIVARDLAPVRPLLAPGTRLLLMLPVALFVAAAAPYLSARGHIERLGEPGAWGLSVLEWVIGLVMMGIALRQAVPGCGIPARVAAAAAGAAGVLVVVVIFATDAMQSTVVPPGMAFRYWYECVLGPMIVASPLLVATVALAMRAFPTHPAAAGGLAGFSAGIVTDAGWRLTCSVSAPSHVLASHALAIAVMAGVGALAAAVLDCVRSRSA